MSEMKIGMQVRVRDGVLLNDGTEGVIVESPFSERGARTRDFGVQITRSVVSVGRVLGFNADEIEPAHDPREQEPTD